MALLVPVSEGELLDKLSILLIKKDRITNPEKLVNIEREFEMLDKVLKEKCPTSAELDTLRGELREVNEALWDIEDELRLCEKGKEFGPRFIELARSVYQTNDRRSQIKYQINALLGSELVEEKSYEEYE
jgi:hypothetical protein